MYYLRLPILFIVFLSAAFFSGCKTTSNTEDEDIQVDSATAKDFENDLQKEKSRILQSLPSPLEVASIIKKSGISYSKQHLNQLGSVSRYTSNHQKALNLGVYGTDLGYAAIYGQMQDAVDYMKNVKRLSEELGIAGSFEKETLQRVEKNLGQQDSLVQIVTENFSKADEFLKLHEKSNASALIAAGGWIEALYIATQSVKNKSNKAIMERIGEQKITLDMLTKILNNFNDDNKIAVLNASLAELKTVYDQVKIEYKPAPPTIDAATNTVIVNTKSTVVINDQVLTQITNKVASLRNQITQ